MRAADLLGRTVRTSDGAVHGRVLDIRITRVPDSLDPGDWEIDGVVIGRRLSFARAGYAYGNVAGPLPLALLMRAAGRHLRFARWADVDVPEDPAAPITLRRAPVDLQHPGRA